MFLSVEMSFAKSFKRTLLAGVVVSALSGVMPLALAAESAVTTPTTETQATPKAQTGLQAASQVAQPEYMVERHTLKMGTLISAKLFGKDKDALMRYATLLDDELTTYEDMMSVHKPTVLNDVNRRSGEAVEIPETVARMVNEALVIANETDGAFEPMIGPVVNLWKIGFGGDKVPSNEAIAKAVKLVDRSQVRLWEEKGHWFMQIGKDQSIDMGAIAKGFIGTEVANALKATGMKRGLVDLGGNVVAIGDNAGKPWRIGIQHPSKDRGGYFGVVSVKDQSVVTSGAYERYFEKDGKRYAHILDAKTGRPVETNIASVTIIDSNGARADALCTALFGMGWERAQAFLKAHQDIKAVLMHGDLKQVALTQKAEPIVKIVDETLKTTVIK